MEYEVAVELLYEEGGLLRRRSWDKYIGITLEDLVSNDWEIVEFSNEEEDEL